MAKLGVTDKFPFEDCCKSSKKNKGHAHHDVDTTIES